MLSIYGVLERNEHGELVIDGVSVIELIEKYAGQDVAISVSKIEKSEEE
ncbi:hypothetical protein [Paenibacillus donghaensis]|nr:hypothetical protein [Paenibacillus donghaensis]